MVNRLKSLFLSRLLVYVPLMQDFSQFTRFGVFLGAYIMLFQRRTQEDA